MAMDRFRVIGSVDNFDGEQSLDEWIQMVERAAEFAGWNEDQTYKAALFRLRGEAGEYAEQLRDEGKITTWKNLKEAMKERFNTAGKEQWHQYLLNTATQGSKTVHEWAQTVRKLSLLALGSSGVMTSDPDMPALEEEEAARTEPGGVSSANAEEKMARKIASAAQSEGKRKLLDYMRKSNFVRGLRSSLRQMVWRKKCVTFDEAVQAAAEEEAVEASHREEEVLSCYKKDIPTITGQGLVEQIVAALEIREEAKKKNQETTNEGGNQKREGARSDRSRPEESQAGSEDAGEIGNQGAEGMYDRAQQQRNQFSYRGGGNQQRQYNARQYGTQLPLPRNQHSNQGPGRRQEWVRNGWRAEQGQAWRGYDNRPVGHYRSIVCFACGETGHIARQCPRFSVGHQGNGYSRLQ